jgi:hypothetical protein
MTWENVLPTVVFHGKQLQLRKIGIDRISIGALAPVSLL